MVSTIQFKCKVINRFVVVFNSNVSQNKNWWKSIICYVIELERKSFFFIKRFNVQRKILVHKISTLNHHVLMNWTSWRNRNRLENFLFSKHTLNNHFKNFDSHCTFANFKTMTLEKKFLFHAICFTCQKCNSLS